VSPRLIVLVGPYVLHNAVRFEMNDAGVLSQCKALLERVLKGLSEAEPVN